MAQFSKGTFIYLTKQIQFTQCAKAFKVLVNIL